MTVSTVHWIPPAADGQPDNFASALALPTIGGQIADELWRQLPFSRPGGVLYVPRDWRPACRGEFRMDCLPDLQWPLDWSAGKKAGLLMINGRRIFHSDKKTISWPDLADSGAITALDADPCLKAPSERVRLTAEGYVAGFRRLNSDGVEPDTLRADADWPAWIYWPAAVCQQLASQQAAMPLVFSEWLSWLQARGAALRYIRVGAVCLDMSCPRDMIHLLEHIKSSRLNFIDTTATVDKTARLIGPIWLGKNSRVEPQAVIVGPSIIADGAQIGKDACVQRAIVLPNCRLPQGATASETIVSKEGPARQKTNSDAVFLHDWQAFRDWPFWTYARLGKRIFDILFSLIVLLLLSPVMVVVAILVKLTSPGPIFYIARRQGLRGKEFGCIKFRTMMVKADALQDHLRDINQVDGPQFKIDDDPRITGIGKFLRDTCIDELPQFINVLLGQMSVVGPRPSPESENQSAPVWRDARLSVRPGITGLWQVCRTRQASMDFQEWVFYDVQYVRNLSFRQDLWICWKTAAKLIKTFLDQFG